MHTLRNTAFAVLAVLLLSSSAEAAKIKIVAFGASHTYSKGVPRGADYPAQLRRMLRAKGVNASVKNSGINGDTTGQMLRRLASAVPAGTQIVIFQPGGNDRRKGVSINQRRANIQRIKARLRARGIKVISMPNRIFGKLRQTPAYVGRDGQHLSISGYGVLASIYLVKVLKAIKRR